MDASDTYHPIFRRLFAAPLSGVVTSSLVITEGHAWFLRRFADRGLALVDAVGLHLMGEGGVASCWSTGRRLGLVGTPLAIHGGLIGRWSVGSVGAPRAAAPLTPSSSRWPARVTR